MKFYVYCLAEKIDTLGTPVSGIGDAKVELIQVEDFSLLVSEFEGESALVTRENALTHDGVIRSVLDKTTPLPFRFGTLVSRQQLGSYISTHRASLETKLGQVRGCVEMSVKIIWNTAEQQLNVSSETAEGPGARFLKEKQRELVGSEHRGEQAKQVASWLNDQVGMVVRAAEVSVHPTEKLIVAAAHLVTREQAAAYRQRLAEARKMRPELHFLVSGPWPPYSFSNIELEFKTRFGVS